VARPADSRPDRSGASRTTLHRTVRPLCPTPGTAILAHPSHTSRRRGSRPHGAAAGPPIDARASTPAPVASTVTSLGTGKEDLLRVVGARLRAAALAVVIASLAIGAQPAP